MPDQAIYLITSFKYDERNIMERNTFNTFNQSHGVDWLESLSGTLEFEMSLLLKIFDSASESSTTEPRSIDKNAFKVDTSSLTDAVLKCSGSNLKWLKAE